jgi:hypothetical protein
MEIVAKENEVLACVRRLAEKGAAPDSTFERLMELDRELQMLEDARLIKCIRQEACNHRYLTKDQEEGCTHCGKSRG